MVLQKNEARRTLRVNVSAKLRRDYSALRSRLIEINNQNDLSQEITISDETDN